MASLARPKATTKLSPSPCSTGRTPLWVAMTSESTRSKRAIAAAISLEWFSHSRVDPSTSASSSVTVPLGSGSLTPRSLQFTSGVSPRRSFWLMLASMRARQGTKHQHKCVNRTPLPVCAACATV